MVSQLRGFPTLLLFSVSVVIIWGATRPSSFYGDLALPLKKCRFVVLDLDGIVHEYSRFSLLLVSI